MPGRRGLPGGKDPAGRFFFLLVFGRRRRSVVRRAGRYDERVLNRLVLKADYLGEARPGQEPHVEGLFHHGLELQQANNLLAA